jgi:hypothetical protein
MHASNRFQFVSKRQENCYRFFSRSLLLKTTILFMSFYSIVQAQELITNGNFSNGMYSWVFNRQIGTTAIGTVVSQEFRCSIVSGGTMNWQVQLCQDNIPLERGKVYELIFHARADVPRPITVGLGMNGGSYQWYDGSGFNITTTMQEYRVRMVMRYPDDNLARLNFQLGVYNVGIFIDNVSLVKIADVGVAILRPQWHEKLPSGSTQEIRWWTTPDSIANVKIEHSSDNGTTWVVDESSTPDDGSYLWTVPNTVSPDYLLRISNSNNEVQRATNGFNVIAGGSASVIGDMENGGASNSYCYGWYYYTDRNNQGNSNILNVGRVGTTPEYLPPLPFAPGNPLGTAGHCMNVNFQMGSIQPRNLDGYYFDNYVACGTMLAPNNQFNNLQGTIGFEFWARADQQMDVSFNVQSGTVTDNGWHHKMITLTTSWQQYFVPIADLSQPLWAIPASIDLTRIRSLEFMLSVENNPQLNRLGGWFEIDDAKTIGFVPPANTPPTFTAGGNIQVNENAGAQNSSWATAMSAGETGQTLTFNVTNDNSTLFSSQPIISTLTGNLSFTPALNRSGIANIAVVLQDNGSNRFCGKNQSDTALFTITISESPTLVSPVNSAPNQALNSALTWNAVAGAVTYRVQLSTYPDFNSSILVDDSLLTTAIRAIGPLSNNTTYYWRVNAKSSGATSGWSDTWSFTTIPSAPVVPTLVTPLNNAGDQLLSLSLTWNAVAGAVTYRVQLSTAPDFNSNIIIDDSTVTSASRVIGPLTNSTTYYYRVNAKNSGGTSEWSDGWRFSTLPIVTGVPTLVTPLNNAADQLLGLSLTWNAVAGAVTYRVQLSTSPDFNSNMAL